MERGIVARGLSLAAVLFAVAGVLLHSLSPDAHALANCTTSTMAIDSLEQQVANEINARRGDHGLSALKLSPNLSRAAAWKSEDSTNGSVTFSHVDSLGRMPGQRAGDCGYHGGAAEILAVGFRSAASVVDGWLGSPGHRGVLLGENYSVMGVGVTGTSYAVKFGFVDDSSDPWDSGTPVPPAISTEPPTPTPTPQPAQAPQAAGIVRGMTAGVNFVSYAGFVQSPEIALRSLGEQVLWVYGWDASRGQWLRYSPGSPDYVNTLKYMVPGEAYYIAVDAAGTWIY